MDGGGSEALYAYQVKKTFVTLACRKYSCPPEIISAGNKAPNDP